MPITKPMAIAGSITASMRPRRARLGCHRLSRRCRTLRVGFNEAEARAPRMRRCPASSGPRPRRFNEAEARAPRMPSDFRQHTSRRGRASMRPRRARLGCSSPAWRSSPRPKGFNEAEARAPRMPGDPRIAEDPRIAASMRPRRARLGCPQHGGIGCASHGDASMRPRRARLGCDGPA